MIRPTSPYADGGRTLGPRMSVDDEAEAGPYIDLITGKPIEKWAEDMMDRDVQKIVDQTCDGFRDDVNRIMAEHKTDYRMNLAVALFEAAYGMNLKVWSDETRDYWLKAADTALARRDAAWIDAPHGVEADFPNGFGDAGRIRIRRKTGDAS